MVQVLNSANRTGEVISPSVVSTTMSNSGFTSSLVLDNAGLTDTTLSMVYTVEGEFDGQWLTLCSGSWRSGIPQRVTHKDSASRTFIAQPSFSFTTTSRKPGQVRLKIVPSKTVRFSADITVR